MKRIYTLFIIIASAYLNVFAQQDTLTAEQVLLSCPAQIMPYLSVEQREQLIHQYKENPHDTAQVKNVFDIMSKLLVLKDNWFRLQLNGSTTMEVAILKDTQRAVCGAGSSDNDSENEILCLMTNKAPEPETTAKIYSKDWKFKKNANISFVPDFFLADTLTAEKHQEALHYIEFPFYSYSIIDVNDENVELSAQISLPTLTKEEKEKIKGCFVQRNVKWNDKTKN